MNMLQWHIKSGQTEQRIKRNKLLNTVFKHKAIVIFQFLKHRCVDRKSENNMITFKKILRK